MLFSKYENGNVRAELNFPNAKETKYNPSIKEIIPHLQIGDILTSYNPGGHTFMIYDLIKDKTGEVIEAIFMESAYGKGENYVNSKVCNGNSKHAFYTTNHYLFYNHFNNSAIDEGLDEGSLGLQKLSEYDDWKTLNKNKYYSVLRFVQEDKDGNAVLYYNPRNISVPVKARGT